MVQNLICKNLFTIYSGLVLRRLERQLGHLQAYRDVTLLLAEVNDQAYQYLPYRGPAAGARGPRLRQRLQPMKREAAGRAKEKGQPRG